MFLQRFSDCIMSDQYINISSHHYQQQTFVMLYATDRQLYIGKY